MKEALKILPVVFYFVVGLISLVMAIKSLSSKEYLPFHGQAADQQWDKIENPLQIVILSLLRLGGLGFLAISLLLMICPVVNYFIPNLFYKYFIPGIALIFCSGLFLNNYLLYKRTKADTPWKGSLYAMFMLAAGIIISIFN